VSGLNRLFVYGTLAPGRPNAHILAPLSGIWVKASVRGYLTHDGWGSALGYPGIRLDPDGAEVKGLLFISDDLTDHWDRLDRFEGNGYRRIRCEAQLHSGEIQSAFIYELANQV
jgi:gamma-glutamylcyclotransferase (GGCT)/AIG2-like uncharacterized protein YtfP